MKRRVIFTAPFAHDYQTLPENVKTRAERAIQLLADNPFYPSLQTKKMEPKRRGILEARISQTYRITFHLDGSTIVLRRAGTHDILRTP